MDPQRTLLSLLRLSSFTVFLGRAWQHLFWDPPFRVLLWDEDLLKPVVENVFGVPWQVYVTSPAVDVAIQFLIRSLGVLYVLCAGLSLGMAKEKKWGGWLLLLGSLNLVFLAFLYTMERFFQMGQFIEYAAQAGAPFLLWIVLFRQWKDSRVLFLLKLIVALTFTGHGLYAVGYYPLPGAFIDMTISILGVSEKMAVALLKLAGVLDLTLAVAIFLPKVSLPFLLYATVWGLLTTLARPVANVDTAFLLSSIHTWLPEMIYRLPHVGVPLAAALWESKAGSSFILRIASRCSGRGPAF